MKTTVSDIHSYIIFANIDNRQGNIKGYRLILSKKQMEAIEDIITSEQITVEDEEYYEVENNEVQE